MEMSRGEDVGRRGEGGGGERKRQRWRALQKIGEFQPAGKPNQGMECPVCGTSRRPVSLA